MQIEVLEVQAIDEVENLNDIVTLRALHLDGDHVGKESLIEMTVQELADFRARTDGAAKATLH
jgi:hypothetical protein